MGTGLKGSVPVGTYFGGKGIVANLIWERLGDVASYVEPFAGSLAVLLVRPHAPRVESVGDACGFVSNFWRAVKHDAEAVAVWLDYPVIERDLEARHYWLLTEGAQRLAELAGDPEGFDAQVAGWWCWGLCCWIGAGWCAGDGPWAWEETRGWHKREGLQNGPGNRQLPHLGNAGLGVHRQLPHLGNAGLGVHRQLPHLGNAGRGVHRKLPDLGNAGRGVHRATEAAEEATSGRARELILALSRRLERVRVVHGDWTRLTGDSVTWKHGVCGIVLDPPYSTAADRTADLYAQDDGKLAGAVAAWAREAGKRPDMRVALCGYDGEHTFPANWTCVRWKARGGYGSQGAADGRGRRNSAREVVWFSPACLGGMPLFEGRDGGRTIDVDVGDPGGDADEEELAADRAAEDATPVRELRVDAAGTRHADRGEGQGHPDGALPGVGASRDPPAPGASAGGVAAVDWL